MKKLALAGCCIAALLAISGCPTDEPGPELAKIKITISDIKAADLPEDGSKKSTNFSLSVFEANAKIEVHGADVKLPLMSTILKGAVSEGFLMYSNSGDSFSLTFSCPEFSVPGNYVLVLGASPDQSKNPEESKGLMYITGSTSSNPAVRKTVSITQSGVTINWDEFLQKSSGTDKGWTANEIAQTFGNELSTP